MSFFLSEAEGFITLYCMGEQMSMPRFHAGIAADLFFLSPAAAVHLSVVGEIHESPFFPAYACVRRKNGGLSANNSSNIHKILNKPLENEYLAIKNEKIRIFFQKPIDKELP